MVLEESSECCHRIFSDLIYPDFFLKMLQHLLKCDIFRHNSLKSPNMTEGFQVLCELISVVYFTFFIKPGKFLQQLRFLRCFEFNCADCWTVNLAFFLHFQSVSEISASCSGLSFVSTCLIKRSKSFISFLNLQYL